MSYRNGSINLPNGTRVRLKKNIITWNIGKEHIGHIAVVIPNNKMRKCSQLAWGEKPCKLHFKCECGAGGMGGVWHHHDPSPEEILDVLEIVEEKE